MTSDGATLADKLVVDNRRADLIIANNVLPQVPNLSDHLAGMQQLLAPAGVITVEVAPLRRLMAENACGTIHHAQSSYFSFLSIDVLADRHDTPTGAPRGDQRGRLAGRLEQARLEQADRDIGGEEQVVEFEPAAKRQQRDQFARVA